VHVNRITEAIIGAAIEVHKTLGPGLLESAYRKCLAHQLVSEGWPVEVEKPLPLIYRGLKLDCGYRLDLLVANHVIVEVKACDGLHPISTAQLLTYLKLTALHVGLLINFNEKTLISGVKRIVL